MSWEVSIGYGLIPAHAGKTSSVSGAWNGITAHPRSRGENAIGAAAAVIGTGSSPLTRGKHKAAHDGLQDHRLIPAHAGKTPSRSPHLSLVGAHPRSRGENREEDRVRPWRRGSSPLTRGKLRASAPAMRTMGLIPAHAGKTGKIVPVTSAARAHPRSRGENRGMRPSGHSSGGSSPLTRGKRLRSAFAVCSSGLIPAHAGKT